MVNVKGSTVVVTGGQRGLGKAIVEELLERGAAKVYATARSPKPSDDPRVVSVALDVTEAAVLLHARGDDLERLLAAASKVRDAHLADQASDLYGGLNGFCYAWRYYCTFRISPSQ